MEVTTTWDTDERIVWERKRKELMAKFSNSQFRIHNSALFAGVFNNLANGADPLQLIDQLVLIIDNQTEEMIKLAQNQAAPILR